MLQAQPTDGPSHHIPSPQESQASFEIGFETVAVGAICLLEYADEDEVGVVLIPHHRHP